ncbi:MAG: SDR family NAD(P)-dependent oxidoreductase [Chloroflexi bacterium]|nr:MAG: SDR family NAD(P)-dependent oxidoreductase [Chloroflexota bacterium]
MRRLLITGGSGYLGRRLIALAVGRWQITATYFCHPLHGDGFIATRMDVRDAGQVAALMAQVRPDVVIHTAYTTESEEAMQRVIIQGTRHVAQAAMGIGARLIHLSTDVLFDGRRGHYTEDDPPSPITPYGRAKAIAEAIVAAEASDAVIVRTSLITGFDPPDPRTRWVLDSLREGREIRLFTDEFRCPVWVTTLAQALLELAELDYRGVLNVAGDQVLTRYEIGVRLARFFGLDPAGITPALAAESGLVRPLDCSLDLGLARRLLRTPLLGLDEVLAVQETMGINSQI